MTTIHTDRASAGRWVAYVLGSNGGKVAWESGRTKREAVRHLRQSLRRLRLDALRWAWWRWWTRRRWQ